MPASILTNYLFFLVFFCPIKTRLLMLKITFKQRINHTHNFGQQMYNLYATPQYLYSEIFTCNPLSFDITRIELRPCLKLCAKTSSTDNERLAHTS